MDRKNLIQYCIRFLLLYCVFYYGTLAVAGLTVPAGYYSPLVEKYFNYPVLFRKILLEMCRIMLQLSGHDIVVPDWYHVRFRGGLGVKVVYSCLGVGLLSFWAAFVIANHCKLVRKFIYLVVGMFFISVLNSIRLSLLVIAANNYTGANKFMVANHHTLFNVACYILILLMIVVYDRIEKKYTQAGKTSLTN